MREPKQPKFQNPDTTKAKYIEMRPFGDLHCRSIEMFKMRLCMLCLPAEIASVCACVPVFLHVCVCVLISVHAS